MITAMTLNTWSPKLIGLLRSSAGLMFAFDAFSLSSCSSMILSYVFLIWGFSASLSIILMAFFLSKVLEGLEMEMLLLVFDTEMASEMYSECLD